MCERLGVLATSIRAIVREYDPDEVAIEETFVNTNGQSTLKVDAVSEFGSEAIQLCVFELQQLGLFASFLTLLDQSTQPKLDFLFDQTNQGWLGNSG
jgi:hypothetical protein